MKLNRLENLADGIFAIVMTLLVLDIRVPLIEGPVSNGEIWSSLLGIEPLLLSYLLSFALLFTYWRAHHFFVSVYAQNLDTKLTNINAIFLALVSLLPFSAQLLGNYSHSQLVISLYGAHIILIGASLWWMREYIEKAEEIKNIAISSRDHLHGTIRLAVPIICSVLAILISFVNPTFSLGLYTFAILFNLLPQSTAFFHRLWPNLGE